MANNNFPTASEHTAGCLEARRFEAEKVAATAASWCTNILAHQLRCAMQRGEYSIEIDVPEEVSLGAVLDFMDQVNDADKGGTHLYQVRQQTKRTLRVAAVARPLD